MTDEPQWEELPGPDDRIVGLELGVVHRYPAGFRGWLAEWCIKLALALGWDEAIVHQGEINHRFGDMSDQQQRRTLSELLTSNQRWHVERVDEDE